MANKMPEASRDEHSQTSRVRTISWGDPAISIEAARSLSGVDFVRKIMHHRFPAPPILSLIDFRLVKVEPGEVNWEFEPAEFHCNPMGGVHAGVVCMLLDSVYGSCSPRPIAHRQRVLDP